MATFNVSKIVFARERLTVTSSAVKTLTAATYEQAASPVGGNQNGAYKRRATGAIVMVDSGSGALHFTVDGTDPTSGVTVSDVGGYAAAIDSIVLESHEAIKQFKAKALSADAIIEVWYLR